MTKFRFTKSARKHHIGRARVVFVIENAHNVVPQVRPGQPDVLMYLGDDQTGRALEVGIVVLDEGDVLVIHAMDLRPKFQKDYDEGRGRQGGWL